MIPLGRLLRINGHIESKGDTSAIEVAATGDSGTTEGAKKGWMKRRFGGGSPFDRRRMSPEERTAWEELDADLADAKKDSAKTAFGLIEANAQSANDMLTKFLAEVKECKDDGQAASLALGYSEEALMMKHDIEQYINMAKSGGATDREIHAKSHVALHAIRKLLDETTARIKRLKEEPMKRYTSQI